MFYKSNKLNSWFSCLFVCGARSP